MLTLTLSSPDIRKQKDSNMIMHMELGEISIGTGGASLRYLQLYSNA